MRLATLDRGNGLTCAAVLHGDDWVHLSASVLDEIFAAPEWRQSVDELVNDPEITRTPAAEATFIRPLRAPGKIICCGLNYLDHIAETGRERPAFPTLFAKFADTLTDPYADIAVSGSTQVDWEAELAVVVGRTVRKADRSEAKSAILGYTVTNDISMRDWQSRTLQWFQGKAWDATTPIGPIIVTADEMDPVDGVDIEASIDGVIVQSSNTRELRFDSADLLSYVSRFCTLRPGDIVLTGTPSGVGLGRTPRRFLADGEVLTTRIAGIGELRNRMRITEMEATR